MNQNKVIDHIFKRLLKSNFSHDEIWTLIKKKEEFAEFKNYIYYLYINSQKKYNDDLFNMSRAINDYLHTIVERHNIKPITINDLKRGDILSNNEIYLLGAKAFDGLNKFSFDVDDNLYILIDSVEHFKFSNIYNIRFNSYIHGVEKSKINLKIINRNFKKILVFTKVGKNNIFIDFFQFVSINHFYSKATQYYGFTISKENCDENEIISYKKILFRQAGESLELLKNELLQITNIENKDLYKFIDIINSSNNHISLIYKVLLHAIKTNCTNVVNNIKNNFFEMLQLDFLIFSLVPNFSLIGAQELFILSNCLDILYGKRINADYLNNIFMCFNPESMKVEDDLIYVRFIKSYFKRFFELDINKKIFNTCYEDTCIYLFREQGSQQNFLFNGYYKLSKIIIGEDNLKNESPVFVLRKATNEEICNHIKYIIKNKSTNHYKTVFNKFLSSQLIDAKWFNLKKEKTDVPIEYYDQTNEMMNSNVVKYNWLIKKILKTYSTNLFKKYLNLLFEFESRITNYLIQTISHNYLYLIENKLMEPWSIAYEMSKNGFVNKDLVEISYIDNYQTKVVKYTKCAEAIKNHGKKIDK